MQRKASCAKVVVFVGALAGCGSSEPPASCPQENEIRGACAGVPQSAVCGGDTCTADVTCKSVTEVGSDAALKMAAAGAMAGACIALAPGKYGDVELPGGVTLLGRSAADVTVGQVTMNAGQGAVLRGLTAATVWVKGATGVKIASVHVLGSPNSGVQVEAQSSVALTTSTIEAPGLYGVYAVDALEVSLDRVLIVGTGGPGLWVGSSSDCAPAGAQPLLEAKSSIVRGSHLAGVGLFGAKATFASVDVLKTDPGDGQYYGKYGGGLSVAGCADVDAKGLRVQDSKSFGVLIDGSKAAFGGMGPEEDIEISRNGLGLSIQNIKDAFKIENGQIDQNQGFGIGVSGDSQGVVICRSGVTNTQRKSLPIVGIGSKDVGDGLVWTGKSSATITDLALSGNALASVLIDGEASGALNHVTLSGGDDMLGIVQQHFTSGAQPALAGGTPSPVVNAGEVHPVPAMPVALPKAL